MGIEPSEFARVLEQVRAWPPDQRLALAQQVLQSLQQNATAPSKSLKDLLGLLQVSGPAPGDDTCRKLLEDQLLRKYGA